MAASSPALGLGPELAGPYRQALALPPERRSADAAGLMAAVQLLQQVEALLPLDAALQPALAEGPAERERLTRALLLLAAAERASVRSVLPACSAGPRISAYLRRLLKHPPELADPLLSCLVDYASTPLGPASPAAGMTATEHAHMLMEAATSAHLAAIALRHGLARQQAAARLQQLYGDARGPPPLSLDQLRCACSLQLAEAAARQLGQLAEQPSEPAGQPGSEAVLHMQLTVLQTVAIAAAVEAMGLDPDSPRCVFAAAGARLAAQGLAAGGRDAVSLYRRASQLGQQQGSRYWAAAGRLAMAHVALRLAREQPAAAPLQPRAARLEVQAAEAALERCCSELPPFFVAPLEALEADCRRLLAELLSSSGSPAAGPAGSQVGSPGAAAAAGAPAARPPPPLREPAEASAPATPCALPPQAPPGAGQAACVRCGTAALEGGRGFTCGRCQRATYCSRACQITDWRRHRPGCVPWAIDRIEPRGPRAQPAAGSG